MLVTAVATASVTVMLGAPVTAAAVQPVRRTPGSCAFRKERAMCDTGNHTEVTPVETLPTSVEWQR
jgi:hypothetical protein